MTSPKPFPYTSAIRYSYLLDVSMLIRDALPGSRN